MRFEATERCISVLGFVKLKYLFKQKSSDRTDGGSNTNFKIGFKRNFWI
jgi:hypothetical protein